MSNHVKGIIGVVTPWVDDFAEFLCVRTGAYDILWLCQADSWIAKVQGYVVGALTLFLLILLGASLYLMIVVSHFLAGFALVCMIIGAIMFCSIVASRMKETVASVVEVEVEVEVK